MKLKYKKAVLLITMCTMFIGLVAFSLLNPSKSTNENKVKTEKTKDTEALEADASEATDVAGETEEAVEEASGQATATEAADATEPVVETEPAMIQETSDEKVKILVGQYLEACRQCDMDSLEDMVTDITKMDENLLKVTYENIEAIQNVECYLADGVEAGSYVVYVYCELKIKDIATLAPGLNRLYVVTGDDGNYRIFLEEDIAVVARINETDQSQEVQDLVEKVNLKMAEAASMDADLKAYNESLTGGGQPATEATEVPVTEATLPPTEVPATEAPVEEVE